MVNLKTKNITDVAALLGGYNEWVKEKLPIEIVHKSLFVAAHHQHNLLFSHTDQALGRLRLARGRDGGRAGRSDDGLVPDRGARRSG